MKDGNKYVFPCGERFSAINTGYCQGVSMLQRRMTILLMITKSVQNVT